MIILKSETMEINMFYGREEELKLLDQLSDKEAASLVTIKGRRRIGKSSLVFHFSKNFQKFYAFSGLPPQKHTTRQSQIDEFAQQLARYLNLPGLKAHDWTDLFTLLANCARKGKNLILFDEISWMGSEDPDFLGKIKNLWDIHLKNNPKLIFVLCGSISSWIDKNILGSTGFLGRISLDLHLKELPLDISNQFWRSKKGRISPHEKFKMLAITGGVPRYLEEIKPSLPVEENIQKLCFDPSGILFNEFDRIFSDLFERRAPLYKEIVTCLSKGDAEPHKVYTALGREKSGVILEYLVDLVKAGFLCRNYTWKFDGKISKLSKFRLSDNYLRFYLRYIEPNKEKIINGNFKYAKLSLLPNWETIAGFQFENLVLNNRNQIKKALNLRAEEVISDNPYFQKKTASGKGGCQIDYLIHARFNTLYVCEIKFQKNVVQPNIIHEVQKKIDLLSKPKNFTVRPVLISCGEVSEDCISSQYFDKIIHFEDLLQS